MKKLKQQFEKWRSKYIAKREYFRKSVEYWSQKGNVKLHRIGHNLLVEADKHIDAVKNCLASENCEEKKLKSSIKELKAIYKELNEYTKPQWRQWAEALIIALTVVFVLRNFLFGLYNVPTGSAEPNLLVGDRVWGNKFTYRFFSNPKRGELVIFDDPQFEYDKRNRVNYFWQKYIGLFSVPLLGLNSGPENIVKRVIAVPGDTIEGRLEDGHPVVYVNGVRLQETYVNSHPLIYLRKKTGFIGIRKLFVLPIPSFLRQHSKNVWYTYILGEEFANQPYYNMSSEEVILEPGTNHPWLKYPHTPTYNYAGTRIVDVFGPMKVPTGKYWVMGDSRKNSFDSRFWGFLDYEAIQGRASFIIYSIDSEEPFWFFDLIKNPIGFWKKSMRWSRFFKGLDGYYGKLLETSSKSEVASEQK